MLVIGRKIKRVKIENCYAFVDHGYVQHAGMLCNSGHASRYHRYMISERGGSKSAMALVYAYSLKQVERTNRKFLDLYLKAKSAAYKVVHQVVSLGGHSMVAKWITELVQRLVVRIVIRKPSFCLVQTKFRRTKLALLYRKRACR